MSRSKAKKHEQNHHDPRLFQPAYGEMLSLAGTRKTTIFPNAERLIVELACGKGEYSVGLGAINPHNGYVGVDIKGERMWMGCRLCDAQDIKNVRFLRTLIHHIDQYFAAGEIDELWIVHPDPRPRGADERRRLTSWRFAPMYHRLLVSGGLCRLKTDDAGLYAYSITQMPLHGFVCLASTENLYESPLAADHYGIETHYEKYFVGRGATIHYAVWQKI